jgi:hypothetical protein
MFYRLGLRKEVRQNVAQTFLELNKSDLWAALLNRWRQQGILDTREDHGHLIKGKTAALSRNKNDTTSTNVLHSHLFGCMDS